MEGLLPMAFRALKKNRTRRRYECLSAGAAESYDVVDFFPFDKTHFSESRTPSSVDRNIDTNSGGARHHRRRSVGDLSSFSCREGRHGGAAEDGRSSPRPGQLVRFRSHRLFSCVSSSGE